MEKGKKQTSKSKRPSKVDSPPKAATAKKRTTLVNRPVKSGKQKTVSVVSPDPLLQKYLREVHKYPLLSREEEHNLAVRYFENKDRESFQKLVASNLRFVVKIAYEYIHYRLKLLDLVQEGNVGLVKAVQEFNPYKEVRLTTYAVWWIRSYIQDFILKNYSLVKLGTTQAQKKLFYHLRSEQKNLEQQGLNPRENIKLLASRLDVREKDIEEMDSRMSHHDLSLNAPVKDQEDGKQHIQNLADPSEPMDHTLGEVEQKEIFKNILNRFSETLEGREKVMFTERLVSEKPLTLQELGDKYGVTKERARQLEEQLKAKLLEYVKMHYPDYELLTNFGG